MDAAGLEIIPSRIFQATPTQKYSIERAPANVTVCAAYRIDDVVARLANELAAKEFADVYVGRFVSEDTGLSSPGFLLTPLGSPRSAWKMGELESAIETALSPMQRVAP
ncbi:hypothetical protein [Bradyrhizobium diazoefficiens]|uniref:hypothetical protein n=1 Tax=Bradyrhizobium diazoefficiens TaxID=1355477 RepID=UPI0034977E7F